jgi:hypothetical protein
VAEPPPHDEDFELYLWILYAFEVLSESKSLGIARMTCQAPTVSEKPSDRLGMWAIHRL